jgi:nitrogen fixation NifU-like protein
MGDELEQMYQEVILDAARNPHGRVSFAQDVTREELPSDSATQSQAQSQTQSQPQAESLIASSTMSQAHESCVVAQSHQFNPTCGDEVTVRIEVSDGSDGKPQTIESVMWDGHGCSISQASLSIMTDLITGKSVDEFTELSDDFHQLMNSRGKGLTDEHVNDMLGDATVFQGVSSYPMRIKCALLGWAAVKDSLGHALSQVSISATQAVTGTGE